MDRKQPRNLDREAYMGCSLIERMSNELERMSNELEKISTAPDPTK
jgi:hypothetical protein